MSKPNPLAARAASAALALALTLLLPAGTARAQDPFSLSGQTTSGPPQQITVTGSSVVDLVQNLVQTQSQFSAFQGQSFNAALNYGAISNAIQFQQNASGTSATLSIPSTGFTRTFTGSSPQDVYNQIKDFLIKDGAKEYAKFMKVVNQQSLLGVVDGNPQAATAVLSNTTFMRFGLHRSPLDAGALAGGKSAFGSGLRLDALGGLVDTDEADGFYVQGSLSSVSRLGDRIGLSLAFPFSYREVEDAKLYMGGLEFALPVVLLKPLAGKGLFWQVTPNVTGAAAGSVDMAAGGSFFGGGVTSSLTIPFGDTAAITIGNGYYLYEGYRLEIGDYEFETDLSQQMLKNGAKITAGLGPVYVDVGATYTNFLQDAAMESYWSPTLGVGFGFGTGAGLRVSYQGDFGDGYRSHGAMATLYLNY